MLHTKSKPCTRTGVLKGERNVFISGQKSKICIFFIICTAGLQKIKNKRWGAENRTSNVAFNLKGAVGFCRLPNELEYGSQRKLAPLLHMQTNVHQTPVAV